MEPEHVIVFCPTCFISVSYYQVEYEPHSLSLVLTVKIKDLFEILTYILENYVLN